MKQSVTTTVNTPISLAESKQRVDEFLDAYIERKQADAATIDPHYEALWMRIRALLRSGGKRFRPYVTLLTFEAYSHNSPESILPAAAAQELLHFGMLIHDDIIDRDDIRYGVKNMTAMYRESYTPLLSNDVDRQHFAQSAALLAGDLLLSEAYMLINKSNVPAESIVAAHEALNKSVFRVIGGELLDTEASFQPHPADPLTILEQKTASYSFIGPLHMGAILAGVNKNELTLLEQFGKNLGIAYQLRDDLLGIFGNEATTGKSTDGDLQEGKRTLLIQEFDRLATDEQKAEFYQHFGTQTGTDVARTLLRDSGAQAAIEMLVKTYGDEARATLTKLQCNDEHKAAFSQLVNMCLNREK